MRGKDEMVILYVCIYVCMYIWMYVGDGLLDTYRLGFIIVVVFVVRRHHILVVVFFLYSYYRINIKFKKFLFFKYYLFLIF